MNDAIRIILYNGNTQIANWYLSEVSMQYSRSPLLTEFTDALSVTRISVEKVKISDPEYRFKHLSEEPIG